MIDEKAEEYLETQTQSDEDEFLPYENPDEFTRSLVLALGVCYHACLEKREEYREFIAEYFTYPCTLSNGAETILENISWCQDVFLDEIDLADNIAKNQALKENVFMMVICIELRIPLFLVGKPGSSKSLAKTIVADAMQGERARSKLYRTLKSVHMVSYQCSQLSTPEGIVGTFSQCAKLQEKQDLAKFVSVVVLDEVGLAEDSPRMPLKTLHPLLEDGCEGDEEPLPYKKVGFIGISNWALDPAKMNRGILVQRGVPDEKELVHSALGICGSNEMVRHHIEHLVLPMAKAYLDLYESALGIREFFGLRDFYSLIKMVCGFASKESPSWCELQYAILRNFGGLDTVKPMDVFNKHLKTISRNAKPKLTDPLCDPASLIRTSLAGDQRVAEGLDSESRYLLILTENYAALGILQQELHNIEDAIIIFGSSFPRDQEYTQVCRNINRIKVCMETGQTVVLLNLENLYESLYDALNQYYIWFGDQRFVDLGLGTQRVKCRVHQKFRLVVVAEKKVVIEKFPIPLINRLEKHFLATDTMLKPKQRNLSELLHRWAEDFCGSMPHNFAGHRADSKQPKVGDVFIGYHTDTAASVILQVSRLSDGSDSDEQILDNAQKILLCCATPESIVRLGSSPLAASYEEISRAYFHEQHNDNIFVFMQHAFMDCKPLASQFIQITTHSHLLVASDAGQIAKRIGFKKANVVLQSLQAFDTEQQFCKMLKDKFSQSGGAARLLILQCDSGDVHADLIACARYNILNEYSQSPMNKLEANAAGDAQLARVHITFIIQLPRIAGGCFVGFQGGRWTCHHIDDLHPASDPLPPLAALEKHSISSLFEAAVKHADGTNRPVNPVEEEMDVESAETEQEIGIVIGDEVEVDASVNGGSASATVLHSRKRQDFEGLRFSRNLMSGDAACIGSGSEVLDVDGIIRKCIHHAIIMLRDAEDCRHRSSIRLELLLKLLAESSDRKHDDLDLISVLRRRIALLLHDKEETVMLSGVSSRWLSNEAASFQNINQAGCFRKAVWQYLESRVTPMLAGILAYADGNKNLDLLAYAVDDKIKWMQDLWLDLLDCSEVTSIKYSDLQPPLRQTELTVFEVKIFGPRSFSPQLPFSYVIKELIDAMVYAAKTPVAGLDGSDENRLTFVDRFLNKSQIGKILLKATNATGGGSEIINRYVHDFVRMTYKTQSEHFEEEFQLVLDDLLLEARSQISLARQAISEEVDDYTELSTEDSAGLTIPSLHFAFSKISGRLNLFAQLAQTLPDSIKKMAANGRNIEMPLDLRSLTFLTESLAPSKSELDNANSRHAWCNKVRSLSPLMLCLLDSISAAAATTTTKHEAFHRKCRCAWNRICALQLFIVHVCLPDSKDSKQDQLSIKNCMPLWTVLGDEADFKTDRSLGNVETFLKLCNGNACVTFFGKNKCPQCTGKIEVPVKLPCGHILCMKCVDELMQLKILECPANNCGKKFPASFKADVLPDKREAMEHYQKYKQRCNAFFMDLVCRLCFTDSPTSTYPPEPEAVKRLMGYITCKSKVNEKIKELKGQKTKKMGVFDDALDPTPVVRSFLLQLLLRSDIDQVREYLQNFFEESRLLLSAQSEHLNELFLLIVRCLEDHYLSQQAKIPSQIEKVKYAQNCLKMARHTMLDTDANILRIKTLEAVASARFGLMTCATWLHQRFITREIDRSLAGEVFNLCDEADRLCTRVKTEGPRVYLMRQIMRQFGMDALRQIGAESDGRWIIPQEARDNQNDAAPDRFIVCGDHYKRLRELTAEVALGKSTDALNKALTNLGGRNDVLERDLMLAFYREITSNAGHSNGQTPAQTLQELSDWCQNRARISNKPLAEALVRNTLTDRLQVTPNGAPLDRALAEAVVHFKILMHGALENGLTQPLLFLIRDADKMANAYLPTMPQDDLEDVKEAMLAARTVNENPTFFQCPNGHPYVIGNCGRPAVHAHCGTCGAAIGGTNHTPVPGNVKLNRADATPTGHVLGTPQLRQAIPERDMSAASTAVLRLLLHMSMYLGATKDPQQVGRLIRPPVGNVLQFLWSHMRFDLDTIHSAIGRSVDDVLVLVHVLLVQAIGIQYQNYGGDARLTSKKSRRTWENAITNSYIAPVLQQLDRHLENANNSMLNDKRLGSNTLMRLLYEVDVSNSSQPQQQKHVIEVPSLWRYREQISLQHAQMSLLNKQSGIKNASGKNQKKQLHPYPVLRLFFREECQLQALRMLPSIVRLHHLLVLRYNRSIDHAEATSMTIQQFLDGIKDDNLKQEFSSLVEDFHTAWNLVHDSLINYVFDQNGRTLPANYAQQTMNKGSPLAQLLPSMRGYGVCSIALVCFLCKKQNDFLEQYSQIREQKLENYVGIFDAINAHLIAFSRERDLQPIVLANCNYSLEVGEGTRVEYDFETMERQVEERFIRGRPRLTYQCDFILFREDVTNAAIFSQLRHRIPQEPLTNVAVIEKELQQKLTDVNDLLANLDIAVGFLVSITNDADESLSQFMTDSLRMKLRRELAETIQSCRLKHVEALWVQLSFMRACMQDTYQQDPFDGIEEKYRDEIPEDLVKTLRTSLQHVDLDVFLRSLYECILFRIAVKQDTNAEDYVDNAEHPLNYVLNEFIEQKDNDIAIPALTDKRFPEEFKVKHCISIWRRAHLHQTKSSGRRHR